MLVIRDEQLKTLEDQFLANQLWEHLTRHYPELMAALPASEARARVEHGIHRARHHGLTRERSIGEFVTLCFTVGPAFDSQPAIAAALAQVAAHKDPDTQFTLLHLRVSPRDWEEAGRA